ncbi:MAG: hypothetical protein SH868_05010 [Bythopirellula sp.]|nr:hypothetical protein [Bythopirellula sp.]
MGRFLAIVVALVAIALVINKYQSRDKPAVENEPKLIAPEKLETPAEKPAEVAANEEAAAPLEVATTIPPSTKEAAPSAEVKADEPTGAKQAAE